MKKKLIAGILTGIVAFAALTGCGGTQTQQAVPAQEEATEEAAAEGEAVEEKGTITVAATAVPHAEILEEAKKILAEQGWNLEITVFDDYVQPNLVVNDGDIDANYFQHQPFLDNAIAKQSFKLQSAGTGILANIGLYSLKHKKVSDVPVNGKVAIANDPVNQGRGLLLLEKAGLIKLKPGVGFLGSLKDIAENPKKLQFVEVEGPQLARITGDVDIAQGYPHFIVASKAFDPSSGLAYSGIEDAQFAIRFVARNDKADSADLKKFIQIYQNSPAVRDEIHRAYASDKRLYNLAWTK